MRGKNKTSKKIVRRKRTDKKKIKKRFWKTATKIHASLTLFCLIFYSVLGIFGGPELMLKDVGQKYQALAATHISLKVISFPTKPLVSIAANCSGGTAYIRLDWPNDISSDTYDIYRDGQILVSGLIDNYFIDTSVQALTTYTYYVIAHGQMGNIQSDDAGATTDDCYVAPPVTGQIITLDGKNLSRYDGTPEITERQPEFSGITNIPNALIEITLYSGPIITTTTTANSNGYWYWAAPVNLDYGEHTLYLTFRDPDDSGRFLQITQEFMVHKKSSSEEKKETEEFSVGPSSTTNFISSKPTTENPTTELPPIITEPSFPFKIYLAVKNPEKILFAGDSLEIETKFIKTGSLSNDSRVKYEILDASQKVIESWETDVPSGSQNTLKKIILLPKLMPKGTYTIRASLIFDGKTMSAEDFFIVKEFPIFNLSGGLIITYPMLLSNLGWIVFYLLLLLMIFIILALIEHYQSNQSKIHIDEQMLKQRGIIG
jgi:hypothetical protein